MSNKVDKVDRVLEIAKSILTLLGVLFSFYVLTWVISWALGLSGITLANANLRIIGVSVWLACAVIVSFIRKKNFLSEYRVFLTSDKKRLAMLPLCAILAFALGIAMNYIVGLLVEVLPTPEAWIAANNESVAAVEKGGVVAVFVALYIAAPLSEELIFRGRGYGAVEKTCGRAVAIILTSLCFAVAHGNILQGIYAFAGGIVFSLLIEKTGSLLTGVAAHAGFNISGPLLGVMLEDASPLYVSIGIVAVFVASFVGIYCASDIFAKDEDSELEDADDGEFDGYDAIE